MEEQQNEIARDHWPEFLKEYSKTHEGRATTLQVYGAGTGTHSEIRQLPLAGIWLDRQRNGSESVEIMFGTEPADHVTHSIPAPSQIWHREGGEAPVLEIRGADGENAILRLVK